MTHLREERGFTLIELLVSMAILVVGLFGLVSTVDATHKLSDVSEHEDLATQVADREMESALALKFSSVGLSSIPTATVTTTDDATQWRNVVYPSVVPSTSDGTTACTATTCNNCPSTGFNESLPNNEANPACLVGSGSIPPVGTVRVPAGATGDVALLKIYRYVTWVNDVACAGSANNCATVSPNPTGYLGDYKRVTIAVQPVAGGTNSSGAAPVGSNTGQKKPVVVSAIKRDPDRGVGNVFSNSSPCGVAGVTC